MTKYEAIHELQEDKRLYETEVCHAGDGSPDGRLLEALDMAIEALSIDAVEVVRCKDYRYFKKIVERSNSGLCYRDLVASAWKENGYCSRGERREERSEE